MNDRYLKYSVEDLVIDDSFIDWVQNPDPEKDKLWNLWILENPQVKSRITEARILVKNLSVRKINTAGSAENIWHRIQTDIGDISPPAGRNRSKVLTLISVLTVAASVLLILIFQFQGKNMTLIEAKSSTTYHFRLPDESTVVLNDASKIEFNRKTFVSNREIHLQGEAFFEVAKGVPFTVQTSKGSVRVLGTSFNVYNHADGFRVQCQTGKVKVSNMAGQTVILTPGLSTHLNPDGTLITSPNSDTRIKWLEGLYEYKEVPLQFVINELERQFNIHIELKADVKNTLYTGFFEDDDMDEALNSVFWPLKLTAETKGQVVTVYEED
jgi:ferric-dicitrate binding protein FerR (iron transport regulator)